MANTPDSTATFPSNPLDEFKAMLEKIQTEATHEDDCDRTHLIERPLPAGYVHRLTPPSNTSYWRHQEFTLMVNQKLNMTYISPAFPDILLSTLTWRIDAYVYVVDAKPDKDFYSNGGAVYVVLVHGGSAAIGQMFFNGLEFRYTVSLRTPEPAAAAMKQLPPSNSGIQSGDTWNYPISFTQDMAMFNNNGNGYFIFQAIYEDSVDLYKGRQTGFADGPTATQWNIIFDEADAYSNFPFASISVFRFRSLEQVTFDCTASAKPDLGGGFTMPSETRSITVDCRFSADDSEFKHVTALDAP